MMVNERKLAAAPLIPLEIDAGKNRILMIIFYRFYINFSEHLEFIKRCHI
jgi:hypothetical protein